MCMFIVVAESVELLMCLFHCRSLYNSKIHQQLCMELNLTTEVDAFSTYSLVSKKNDHNETIELHLL